jgi:hypothetical protein
MLDDGARARGDEMNVLDVAQLVRRALPHAESPEPATGSN